MPEDRVIFGVLTRLGSAMLLTGLLESHCGRFHPAAGFAISAVLFGPYPQCFGRLSGFAVCALAAADTICKLRYSVFWLLSVVVLFYGLFCPLPWLFLFWAGTFSYGVVGRQRMGPLRRSVCPPLGWLGRHSLLLYLLHQPVIYGVLLVVFRVLGG